MQSSANSRVKPDVSLNKYIRVSTFWAAFLSLGRERGNFNYKGL